MNDGGPDGGGDFATLLAGARAGEPWAVRVLFRDLQPRLLRYLRSQEPRVADDLAGEVWLAVVRGLADFCGDDAGLRAWVFTIARRRVIEHRRRSVRRRTEPAGEEVFAGLAASGVTDRDALVSLGAQDAVDLIRANLSEDQAEVVLLRVLADLDVAQVAALMDRPETWVRVTQHRALQRLAERIGPKIGVTP